jgi:putative ABC transport system permease protein
MLILRLIVKNAIRHQLRTLLTLLGFVVAITAFGLLRTIVDAWYAGVEASSAARLVSRNAISLVFPMPRAYEQKIKQMDGVNSTAAANWFGGVYITERNFFPQFAIDAEPYLAMYPEFKIDPAERKAFMLDKSAAVVGAKIAREYGWKVGDTVALRGTIYPGTWNFTVRAIYTGADKSTDESQFFFHWGYLSDKMRQVSPLRKVQPGVFLVEIKDANRAAEISQAIDASFKNSLAETLTETEKAFQLGFVSMTEAILVAIQAVSFMVILIIMAVMANTMAMSARERTAEYSTLKALGFSQTTVSALIVGESILIALLGGLIGIAVTLPLAGWFGAAMGSLFPVFLVSSETMQWQLGACVLVGVIAAALPAWRAANIKIVDGLRAIA